jgi:hypothetical protein
MKKSTTVLLSSLAGAVVIVAIGFPLAGRWIERWQAAGRLEMKSRTISNFRQHQSQYLALIPEWKRAFRTVDSCGQPIPAPGSVQFHAFGIKDKGSYRVAVQLDDRVLPTAAEAARALNVEVEAVASLASGLRSVGRDSIFQSGYEINIPAEANQGVLLVPPFCPQASGFEAESRSNSSNSYVDLVALGNGWYYYAEWQ